MVRRGEFDREATLERAVREVVDDASRPVDGDALDWTRHRSNGP